MVLQDESIKAIAVEVMTKVLNDRLFITRTNRLWGWPYCKLQNGVGDEIL